MTARVADGRSDLGALEDGARVGRFVLLRDADGRRHAVAVASVLAVSEAEEGDALLQLPGGRALRVGSSIEDVLSWLGLPA